jgi:hypothetical protein
MRAEMDRELSGAVQGLLIKAAEYDGEDLIEANVDLANWMLANLTTSRLAAAAAAMALHAHRQSVGADRG